MIVSIGIDVSKIKLDVYQAGKLISIKNQEDVLKSHFTPMDRGSRIVMEATGKYHRLAHRILTDMGFAVMIINPYQSKHFAKALNLICKTDGVDAKMLSMFGEKMDFKPTLLASEAQIELQDLSKHLADLKQVKQDLESRLGTSRGFVAKSLKKALETIEKEIKATEQQLKMQVQADEMLCKKLKLICSIPGIGLCTGLMLLSYLKELGTLGKNQIAALSGLAPMNYDSGQMSGKRRVRGGRRDVRAQLYMPIVGAATQHNERLKVFYSRQVATGKAKKVVLTACMRKIVVWANAILCTGLPWQENFV